MVLLSIFQLTIPFKEEVKTMKKKVLALTLSMLTVFSVFGTVFATDNIWGYKWPDTYPTYWNATRSDIQTPAENAVSAWNNSTVILMGGARAQDVPDIMMESDNYGATDWNGQTSLTTDGTTITHADVQINEYWKDTEKWNNEKTQAVVGHELGHAVGASHPASDEKANMYPTDTSYNVYGTYKPTTHDINTVNSIY
jgi:predicted Zn-dependent protease